MAIPTLRSAIMSLLAIATILFVVRDVQASYGFHDPDPGALKHQQHVNRPLQPLMFASYADSLPDTGSDMPEGALASDIIPWSKMAFQSYRDGNWEIYLSASDGSQAQRLTNNTASDVQPKLNRGATKVVFSSNAAGNWDIFTVENTGANLRRLTNTVADEASPEWSPNGSAIVFSSNRDGNWEIYRMSAGGSNPTRLTVHAAQDVSPIWSPDGDQIAWVRRGEIYNAIWIMNADGSDKRILRDGLPYLGNIAWSPNGAWIAFDFDADRDGWSELGVFDIQSNSHQVVYDPGRTFVDAWMGGWSPDGEWLLFSRLEYIVQNNQLYLDRAFLERIRWSGGAVTRVSGPGFDLEPNWQTTDVARPYAALDHVERYVQSSTGHIDLRWTGQDSGPAGLRHFELQAKRASGGDWYQVTRTQQSSHRYTGVLGETYAFRVRAIDNAYNKSHWSGNSNTLVTTYRWRLSGQVVDARGNPLEDASIVVDPVGVAPVDSALDGLFTAYLMQQPPAVVRVEKQGYGSALPTALDRTAQAGRLWVLGPSSNALANGAFEENDLLPWQPSGTVLPALDRTHYHTGAGSALLNATPSTQITTISQTASGSMDPRVVADLTGRVHILWREQAGLMYSVREVGGSWSPPEYLVGIYSGYDLTVTADNAVHVVYLGTDTSGLGRHWVGYVTRTPAGVWMPARNLSGFFPMPSFPDSVSPPFIAHDSTGTLFVTWSLVTGIWLIEKPAGQNWSAATRVVDEGMFPTPIVTSDDVVHILWLRSAANGGELVDSWRQPTGTWSDTETGIGELTAAARGPVASDGLGRLHLIVSDWGRRSLRYVQRNGSGEWLPPVSVVDMPEQWISGVSLTSTADGNLHLAWKTSDAPNNMFDAIYYSLGSPDGVWSQPLELMASNFGQRMSGAGVAVSSGSTATVIWNQGPHNADREVIAVELDVTTPQDTGLSQSVAIPLSMHAPTLSFVYTLAIAENSGAAFEASVNGTTVFSATRPAHQWTVGWADLSHWAGQTVEIGFRSRGTAISGPVVTRLDDVTVGAWLTPAVSDVMPQPVPAGVATVLTIRGANFIPTPVVRLNNTPLTNVIWVDANTLRATVPADFALGLHTLRVQNPSGADSALQSPLQVGGVLFLPLVNAKLQ